MTAKPYKTGSPCISVCTIDEDNGYCRGCYRTLDEVTHWISYSEEERKRIWGELDARKKQYGDSDWKGY